MAAILGILKAIIFLTVSAAAILCLYAAIAAVSDIMNVNMLLAGVVAIACGILLGPLFCATAGYGLVYHMGRPTAEAVLITTPVCLAWCFAAARALVGARAR